MDLDHIENPLTLYQGWIDKGLDLKALGIVLVYITPSGKGLKIVFKARLIEKAEDYVEDGCAKVRYRKTGLLMI